MLDVDTHGKALLIRLDGGLSLYAHNQLYGVWYIRERGKWPKTRRSLRVALHTELHSALPADKPREFAVKTRNRLARQTLLIARRAYETGGITNAPARVCAMRETGVNRRHYRFAVFA